MTPIENLLTETDSPYQYTDKMFNKPYFVEFAIKKIAEIKKIEEELVTQVIHKNFKKHFKT